MKNNDTGERSSVLTLEQFLTSINDEIEKRHYRLKEGPYAIGANGFRDGARWAYECIARHRIGIGIDITGEICYYGPMPVPDKIIVNGLTDKCPPAHICINGDSIFMCRESAEDLYEKLGKALGKK